MSRRTLTLGVVLSLCIAVARADPVSPLYARGYTVLPQPQVVKLGSLDFVFSSDWKLELTGVAPSDIAVQLVQEELKLSNSGHRSGTLRLILPPNSAVVDEAQHRGR